MGALRVLVLCGDPGVPLYGPSGSSAHLRGVTAALVARGHDVRLCVPRLADARGATDERLDLPVFTAEPRRWGWLPRRLRDRGETFDGRRLARLPLADGWRPDLVWERYSLLCDAGDLGVPRLLEVNAPLSRERTVRNPGYALALEQRVVTGATRVAVVSRWLATWARELGCTPERVRYVPNGTALPPGDRLAGRRRHGLEGLVLGFVGSMKPWHGLERLPALLDALPEASCVTIGAGPVTVEHPRLRPLGSLEGTALADAIAALDVALVPYPLDAPPWFCPLKVLDYRSQGVPIVGSDVGETRSLVGDAGEVLPASAGAEAWAAAVRRWAGRRPEPYIRPWTTVVDEALAGLLEA